MRQEPNNEMDLMLRRLGRQSDSGVSTGDHLDADELSAFAENALPPAARARYTVHLADCSACRSVVAQLSSAAGFAPGKEPSTVIEPSALSRFFGSVFSPLVMRYAAPALGLIVVAAIGFVVLRDRQGDGFLAQRTNPAATSEVSPYAGTLSNSPEQKSESAARVEGETRTDTASKEQQPAGPNSRPAKGYLGDVAQERAVDKVEATPVAAAPPASAAKPAATEEQPRDSEARGFSSANTVNVKPGEVATKNQAVNESDDRKAGAPTTALAREPRSRSATGAVSPQVGVATGSAELKKDTAAEKEKQESAETRSVAGRRFRRQGGVWIDTAYDSSRAIVNVARDSEHYRSLTADEPALKTISEQLNGEIIVVWKGRVYRIH